MSIFDSFGPGVWGGTFWMQSCEGGAKRRYGAPQAPHGGRGGGVGGVGGVGTLSAEGAIGWANSRIAEARSH